MLLMKWQVTLGHFIMDGWLFILELYQNPAMTHIFITHQTEMKQFSLTNTRIQKLSCSMLCILLEANNNRHFWISVFVVVNLQLCVAQTSDCSNRLQFSIQNEKYYPLKSISSSRYQNEQKYWRIYIPPLNTCATQNIFCNYLNYCYLWFILQG